MEKKVVFISHISEEKELAIKTKELIETAFLGMIEVFVSSYEHSISLGQKWLDNITQALKECAVEIILCSPNSVGRQWINFEAGAGWIRDIPVIPFCHSGMIPTRLPMPLNLLQAATANEISSLKLLFPVLAQALGSQIPTIDFSVFIQDVKKFEEKYTFWSILNYHLNLLNKFCDKIIPSLKQKQIVQLRLSETQINFLSGSMRFFSQHNLIELKRIPSFAVGNNGAVYVCKIIPLNELDAIWGNPNCIFK